MAILCSAVKLYVKLEDEAEDLPQNPKTPKPQNPKREKGVKLQIYQIK